MWTDALSSFLTAMLAWAMYKKYVAALWTTLLIVLLTFSNYILILVNSLLVALVIFRGLFDRFKKVAIAASFLVIILKIIILTDLYLDEKLTYTHYVLDGMFTGISIFMVFAYEFKPPKLENVTLLTSPAVVLATPASTPAALILGVVSAVRDASPYFVLALATLNAIYLYLRGEALFFLPPLLFLAAYGATYKRVFYTALRPPAGWLYSWLGGRYKVLKVLGVGGFSFVLAVKHGRALYAAKILRLRDDYGAPLAEDEKILALFGQEMNRYLEIKSPHVVKAFEVYLPAVGYRDLSQYMRNPPYILLEYMEGGTLRDLLRARRRLPVDYVIELFRQLARGLADIHSHRVVHLDIKPENIIFARDKKVAKIGDMGIAKVIAGSYVSSSYMSPAYAAPEVKNGTATFASDVYSLGCVVYEALTGINPNVFVENKYAIPPPSSYNRDVPPWLDSLLLRMLEIDPSKRPSAEEVLRELEKYL
ncbi:MAG: serine/threonine-protein kinase [Pyrobaculum sp.]